MLPRSLILLCNSPLAPRTSTPSPPRRSSDLAGQRLPRDRAILVASREHHGPVRRVEARIHTTHWTMVLAARDKEDRKSTRLNSSHTVNSYADLCLKKQREIRARLTARSNDTT